MREQLELTAILLCIALVSGAMFLFPEAPKVEERRTFLELWWSESDTVRINKIDSAHIYAMPIAHATKRSLWFRRKRNWPYQNFRGLIEDPYLKTDSMFFSLGKFDFSVNERRRREKVTPVHHEAFNTYLPLKKTHRPVDLNMCDSISLDALPGIGPGMVRILLDYRHRYGFIANINHFKRNTFFGEAWREDWNELLILDSIPPPSLSLAGSTFEELRQFPELNYNQVKRICFYRESFEVPTWQEIAGWEEFSQADTTFLQLYISRN